MKNNLPVILATLLATVFANPAFAHVGHLGELAGHSHVIALGAGVAAAVLAGLVIRKRGEKSEDAAADEETIDEADDAPETA